jgi:hypothetical protein
MSKGIGITTTMGCLRAGEPIMAVMPSGWWGTDDAHEDQKYFLAHQLGWRKGLPLFGNTLRSFAHFDYSAVQRQAEEWKMRIQIPTGLPSGGVLMISQYKEMLNWLYGGTRVDYLFDYPTFWLKMGLGFFMHRFSSEPVISIATDSETKDVVYMTRWPELLSGMSILRQIEKIEDSMTDSSHDYDGVQIPCVLSDMNVDLSWILGIRNENWHIAWAVQKILFGMNEKGFAVQEETGMLSMKGNIGSKPVPYVVSPNRQPFLFWRRRPGVDFPLSIYQFTSDDFKDPGNLSNIVS